MTKPEFFTSFPPVPGIPMLPPELPVRVRRLIFLDREIEVLEREASEHAARTLIVPLELLRHISELREERESVWKDR